MSSYLTIRVSTLPIARSNDTHWLKWQIVLTSIATKLGSASRGHKIKATFVTKIITTINLHAKGCPWWGRKAAVTSRSTHNWCLNMQNNFSQALCYRCFVSSLPRKSKRPLWPPMQRWMLWAIECIQTPMPLDNHDDLYCHNNCDVSTHAQHYFPIATEWIATSNYKLILMQKPNCSWLARW